VWLGTCIGRRNYKMFIYFVSLLASFCLFIVSMGVLSVVVNVMEKEDNEQALGERWYTFIIIVYAGIVR
jgi:hypothetical protein